MGRELKHPARGRSPDHELAPYPKCSDLRSAGSSVFGQHSHMDVTDEILRLGDQLRAIALLGLGYSEGKPYDA